MVPLLNHVREVTSGWWYRLFLADLDVAVDDIVESGAFRLRTDTQYERHYRETRVRPADARKRVLFNESPDERSDVEPSRPDEFTDGERRYPRAATERVVECPLCDDGAAGCPNCEGEREVTCPECHTHRDGGCARCEATGRVDCGLCHGGGSCGDCNGHGNVECGNCRGGGTVTLQETLEKTCPNCNGRGTVGDSNCRACRGDGYTTERVQRQEQCSTCDGTGRHTCGRCSGSGNCSRCRGDGLVTCDDCNGSGNCSFCAGGGTKGCPTCDRDGTVDCPVCEREGRLLQYTVDRYEFEHVVDDDVVVPDVIDVHPESFDSTGTVELDALEAGELESSLGLLNARLDRQRTAATDAFERLLATARDREFDRIRTYDDEADQQRALDTLVGTVERDWRSRPSDSYRVDYKLGVSNDERTTTHDGDYRTILFDRHTFEVMPVTLVALRMNGRRRELFAAGTRAESDLSLPSFVPSPRKIGALGGAVGGAAVAAYHSPLLGTTVPAVPGTSVPWFGVAGALSIAALLTYCGLVYRTATAETETVLVVVGPDDALTTTFLSVLAHSVANRGAGEVKGDIDAKLSEDLFGDLTLGASLTYAVDLGDGPALRLVGLSSSAYESMDDDVRELLDGSDGVVGVFGREHDDAAAAYDRFRAVVDDVDADAAVVSDDEDVLSRVDGIDVRAREAPVERFREGYLDGDLTVDATVVDVVEELRGLRK